MKQRRISRESDAFYSRERLLLFLAINVNSIVVHVNYCNINLQLRRQDVVVFQCRFDDENFAKA